MKTSPKDLEKQYLWSKISIIYKSLQKPGSWYTGLAIKKYIQKNIFTLSCSNTKNTGTANTSIHSGRWSAYCHFSRLLAFRNLLDKHHIISGNHVLIHPLLPAPLVDELISRGCILETLDISKNDLGFNQDLLNTYFEEHEEQDNFPQLIIEYGFTGIYKSMLETIKKTYQLAIPTMVVIDNNHINVRLLEIFDEHKLGSVLWFFGDSFLDDHINEVLEETVESQNWHLSWYLETRTRSILEYHLSNSHDVYLPLIKNYVYLLIKKYQKLDIKSFLVPLVAQKLVLKLPSTKPKEVTKQVHDLYDEALDFAVPDLVFELHESSQNHHTKSSKLPIDHYALADFSAQVHIKAKSLYDYFARGVATKPQGSLEVPFFYSDRTYLEYFFYTSEKSVWYNELKQKGYTVSGLPESHQFLRDSDNTPNAQFICKYLLSIDLVD